MDELQVAVAYMTFGDDFIECAIHCSSMRRGNEAEGIMEVDAGVVVEKMAGSSFDELALSRSRCQDHTDT